MSRPNKYEQGGRVVNPENPLKDGDTIKAEWSEYRKEWIPMYVGNNKRPETTQKVLETIAKVLDDQDVKGMQKYGESVDQAQGYDWKLEALQELADCVKYQQREIERLERTVRAVMNR